MKVKRIDLDDEEMPERIHVELSHDEAAYVAVLLGTQNSIAAEETMSGGAVLNDAVYSGLAYSVFNRFYDDGVDGAVARLQACD